MLCQGHHPGPNEPMGETVYCNGKCQIDRVIELVKKDDDSGMCISCGAETDPWEVEPDAENYLCDSCGEEQVFGAEALLLVLA